MCCATRGEFCTPRVFLVQRNDGCAKNLRQRAVCETRKDVRA